MERGKNKSWNLRSYCYCVRDALLFTGSIHKKIKYLGFLLLAKKHGVARSRWSRIAELYTYDYYGGILELLFGVDLDENAMFDIRNIKKYRKEGEKMIFCTIFAL